MAATSCVIDCYRWSIGYDSTTINITAVHYKTLLTYQCDITSDHITEHASVQSLIFLHHGLLHGFSGTNTANVALSAEYNAKNDKVHLYLVLTSGFKERYV